MLLTDCPPFSMQCMSATSYGRQVRALFRRGRVQARVVRQPVFYVVGIQRIWDLR